MGERVERILGTDDRLPGKLVTFRLLL